MYTPSDFAIEDTEKIHQFIQENSFGILLSHDETGIQDTHLPFSISEDGEYLIGHIARANPQWKGWSDRPEVKVIFHGPHAYISPRFYQSDFNVPTWNYTAVSMAGQIEIMDSLEEQKTALHRLVAEQENSFPEPWVLDETNEGMMRLFSAIVFFRIKIENCQAKFKLNQNKSREDCETVITALRKKGQRMDLEVASLMKKELGLDTTQD